MSVMEEEETGAAAPATHFEFDEEFQTKVAALALRDGSFAVRTQGLIEPGYFSNDALAVLVKIGSEHFNRYLGVPDRATLANLIREAKAKKIIRGDMIPDVTEAFGKLLKADISNPEYVAEQVGTFARARAVENAILESVGYLEKGNFSEIEKRMRVALDVGVADDNPGILYWSEDEIEARTEHRKKIALGLIKRDGISTGIELLDKHLYHGGWGRGELHAVMGGPKSGKSMGLGYFGKNASLLGFNVLYITLEVSPQIITDRLDAAVTETLMRDLTMTPHDVADTLRKMRKGAGQIAIHGYPSGTFTSLQMRRLLQRYRAGGTKFDMVIADYADIMAPAFRTDDKIENSKSIWLDLRAISQEEHAAGLTGTQLNREGAKATTAKGTDVAEDYNKIRIADLVLGINATDEEKTASEARVTFVANRNGEEGLQLRIQQDRARMTFIKKVIGYA